MDNVVFRVPHTGSGNAQVKSPRGEVVPQDFPISIATDVTRVDSTVEVETGVKATRSISGQLTCHYCGRENFKRACGLARHQKFCKHRPKRDQETNHTLSCQHCQRFFKSPCGLTQHLKTCTDRQTEIADKKQNLICPKCERSDFQRPCGLARHVKSCKKGPTISDHSSTLATNTQSIETSSSVPQSSLACQTEESASTQATGPRKPHSAGDSKAKPFGPTLSNSEVSNFAIEEPLRLPSAGCRQYWVRSNAALSAIIRTELYYMRSMPPQKAMQQLEKFVHSFFFSTDFEENQPQQPSRKKTTPTTIRSVRKKLRSLRKEWRQQQPTTDTIKLRREFHQMHKRLKRLRAQQRSLESTRKQTEELRAFRADPYKYGRRLFKNKSTDSPTFSAATAENYFADLFADENREKSYSRLDDLPPHLKLACFFRQPHHQLSLNSRTCSKHAAMLLPLGQTASQTSFGNAALVYRKFCTAL